MGARGIMIGDLHLDGLSNVLPDNIKKTAHDFILEQAFNYCQKTGIKLAVFLGDIFDRYPGSMEAHICFTNWLCRFAKAGIATRTIDGNHGFEDHSNTSLSLLRSLAENGCFGDCKIVTHNPYHEVIDKTSLVYLPWPHHDPSPLTKKKSIVFAHLARPGVITNNGYELQDIDDFDIGKHFYGIGDIHLAQEGKGYIYPGSPLQLKFDDNLVRHFVEFEGRGKKDPKLKKIPIDLPYRLFTVEAHTVDDLKSLEDRQDLDFIKIKASPEIYANSDEIYKKYKNITIEPLLKSKKAKNKNEQVSVDIFENTAEERRKLLRKRLEAYGLQGKTLEKALKEAKKAEKEVGITK